MKIKIYTLALLYVLLPIFIYADISSSDSDFLSSVNEQINPEIKEWNNKRDKEDEEAKKRAELARKNTDSSSYCYGSGVTEGMKNVCLAIVKHKASYCFGSGINEGNKNICLANVKHEASYCFGSGLTEGMKNSCLASVKKEPSYCFGSGLSEGSKNVCLAGVKHEPSYCYGTGVSEGMKNMCLALSNAR